MLVIKEGHLFCWKKRKPKPNKQKVISFHLKDHMIIFFTIAFITSPLSIGTFFLLKQIQFGQKRKLVFRLNR